ncbi:MAG: signal peptidase I [Clostridiales bacterium]|nr:signal peptidase I [Clostridiales bacterium]
METKAENTRRIRELEAEFSDERIAEFFPADDDMAAGKRRGRRARTAALRALLIFGIIAVCVAIAARSYMPKIVQNDSMESTLKKMDCVIVIKHAYDSTEVGFGDVILHGSDIPDGSGGTLELINRVIGLPGDEIEIRAWGVYRNGGLIDEPYLADGGAGEEWMRVTVPEGRCFVLGDNRMSAIDSRDDMVGFVSEADIRGKVAFRLLPVSRAGGIQG